MQFTQRKWMKEYFTFSQKEKRAVIVLAFLAALFALLPSLFPFLVKNDAEVVIDEVTQQALAKLEAENTPEQQQYNHEQSDLFQPKQKYEQYYSKKQAGVLFVFDPNTASQSELQQLGLRDKTIQTLLNYRNKGGRFYKPEDVSRIYGLSPAEYERLLPYIKITPGGDASKAFKAEQFITEKKFEPAAAKNFLVHINTADTMEWKKLPGIGSKLSQRIIHFREKLGGFVSVDQVAETFGLPDSTFQKIKDRLVADAHPVKKININTAGIDELKTHPYIKYPIANAIVQYRNEHGSFKALTDILNVAAIDEKLYRKLSPYLEKE
jgi:competence ComEA-like helix-hairpin-helix protein